MRTCEEYETMISAFIDGALTEEDQAELMAHMAQCPACQDYFNDQIAIHDALRGLEDQAPEGFTERVMAQVRRESRRAAEGPAAPEERKKKVTAFPLWRRYAAMAACCAVVAAACFWAFRGGMPSANSGVPAEASLQADSAAAAEGQDSAPADTAPEAAATGSDAGGQGARKEDAPQAPAQGADTSGPENRESGAEEGASAPAAGGDSAAAGEDQTADRPTLYSAEGGASRDSAADAAVTLTTGSPLAEAWVAENLGEAWEAGARYTLTVEQFDQVQALLEANGESFVLALPPEEDQEADGSLGSADGAVAPPANDALTEDPPPADGAPAEETAYAGDAPEGETDTEDAPAPEAAGEQPAGSAADDTPPVYVLQAAP